MNYIIFTMRDIDLIWIFYLDYYLLFVSLLHAIYTFIIYIIIMYIFIICIYK